MIVLASLPDRTTSPEWLYEFLANERRDTQYDADLLGALTFRNQYYSEPQFHVVNGARVSRTLLEGRRRADGTAGRLYGSTMAGREVLLRVAVLNQRVTTLGDMTRAERMAWARGVFGVHLSAFPASDAAIRLANAAQDPNTAAEAANTTYPKVRCGDRSILKLTSPREGDDLLQNAPPANEAPRLVERIAGVPFAALSRRLWDVWAEPNRSVIIPMPTGAIPSRSARGGCVFTSGTQARQFISYDLRTYFWSKRDLAYWNSEVDAIDQTLLRELPGMAGVPLQEDAEAFYEEPANFFGRVRRRLFQGSGPPGRAIVYVTQIQRGSTYVTYAMLATGLPPLAAMPQADREALARGLLSIRLASLPP